MGAASEKPCQAPNVCYTLYMSNTTYPLPMRMEAELRDMLAEAAERTGLSQSELVRQSIRRALPQIVRANAKPPGLPPTSLQPLTPSEWRGVNRAMRRDRTEIRSLAQRAAVPSKEELD